jgi:hypothetical protein
MDDCAPGCFAGDRADFARILCPHASTGDVDWGLSKMTKRDDHAEACSALHSAF